MEPYEPMRLDFPARRGSHVVDDEDDPGFENTIRAIEDVLSTEPPDASGQPDRPPPTEDAT
jgi:hypothetical protein